LALWRCHHGPEEFSQRADKKFAALHRTDCPNQSSAFKVAHRGGGHPVSRTDYGPVSRPDYYRQYALECLRLADGTNEPSTKAVLIDMAQAWIKLVEQSQRNRRFDLVYEAPSPGNLPVAS
jgi:hypothetical protein